MKQFHATPPASPLDLGSEASAKTGLRPLTEPAPRDFLYYAYARNCRGSLDVFKVRRINGRLLNCEPRYENLTVAQAEARVSELNRALAS